MKRRDFVNWVGVGLIASFLPVAIAACTKDEEGESQEKPSTKNDRGTPRSDGFESVGTLAQLDSSGGQLLDKEFVAGPVLVIRNPDDTKNLTAVNPTCPHQNCSVGWQTDNKIFLCPCHGSKFAVDGKVLEGPAKKPLSTYQVKVENNSILVKSS